GVVSATPCLGWSTFRRAQWRLRRGGPQEKPSLDRGTRRWYRLRDKRVKREAEAMTSFRLNRPEKCSALGLLAFALMLGCPGLERASAQELAPYITVYEGTGSAEIASAIAEYVQQELGVELRFEALSHGVIHSRVQAEAPNFGADLVTNAGFPLLQQAKEEGWSVAYKSPTWADADAEWADPDGHWWINSRWNFVLV